MLINQAGSNNTANGYQALYTNSSGSNNSAVGYDALYANNTGYSNSALGASALTTNTTGYNNVAVGQYALELNVGGFDNTSVGNASLKANTSGSSNVALGRQALEANTTGTGNIAIGANAGSVSTTGSNNIEIGNKGAAADANVIKIGTEGTQTKTFIAGIYGTSVTGNAVMVSSTGQLGVVVSSERFKTGIVPMGSDTAKLAQLRPVAFTLKSDPEGTRRYGLIAEEVAKVYPELVIRDESGRIDGVRYDELAPMLLNEMQHQDAKIRGLEQQLSKVNDLERELAQMHAALAALQSGEQLVAQR
jgi:hypothetical protein